MEEGGGGGGRRGRREEEVEVSLISDQRHFLRLFTLTKSAQQKVLLGTIIEVKSKH